MREERTDKVRLLHILDANVYIEKFSSGKSKNDFYNDAMYRFSVERQPEIIGEAANNLSFSLIEKYDDVPWPQIISFRNFIVHEYFGLDLELVWNVIKEHIPPFKIQIEHVLKDITSS